jgi:hypothetical protein|tara:strand:- start:2143 stop:2388 length:246 start_codon:yes stop_codon:yes gene_type:complete
MPYGYGYPSESKMMKTVKQGEMSDVKDGMLYREKMESDLVGSTKEAWKSSVDAPSPKGVLHMDASLWKMADDHSVYSEQKK